MRARHRAHRILAAHQLGDHRIHGRLLLLFVLRQAFEQERPDRLELPPDLVRRERPRAGPRPARIRASSGANSAMLRPEPLRHLRPGRPPAAGCLVAGSARRALRITATSIASWTKAPATGTQQPEGAEEHGRRTTGPCRPARSAARSRASVARSPSPRRAGPAGPRSARRRRPRDEAVAPRAPIATPTSAAASAGASLIPSPTMIVTPPAARSASTAATFSAGSRSDSTRSTPERGADRLGHVGVVARHHHDALDPGAAQRAGSRAACRGGSGRRSTMAPATSPSTATNTQRRSPRARCGAGRRGRAAAARRRARRTPPCRARPRGRRPSPGCRRRAPRARRSGKASGEVALPRGADDRRRQHVRRDLVERGGQAQQLVRVDRIEDLDLGDLRHAGGERAGLVEQQHRAAGERLQRAAALDDDAAAGRAARCRRRSRSAPPGSTGTAWRRRARRARAPDRPTASQAAPAMTSVTGMNTIA